MKRLSFQGKLELIAKAIIVEIGMYGLKEKLNNQQNGGLN